MHIHVFSEAPHSSAWSLAFCFSFLYAFLLTELPDGTDPPSSLVLPLLVVSRKIIAVKMVISTLPGLQSA